MKYRKINKMNFSPLIKAIMPQIFFQIPNNNNNTLTSTLNKKWHFSKRPKKRIYTKLEVEIRQNFFYYSANSLSDFCLL